MTDDVYQEILRTAEAVVLRAGVKSKSRSLVGHDLPMLYSLRESARLGDFDTTAAASLEIIGREIDIARENNSAKSRVKVMHAFIYLLIQVASQRKHLIGSARFMAVTLTSDMQSQPMWLKRVHAAAPKALKVNDVEALTGLNIHEWNELVGRVVELARGGPRILGSGELGPVGLDVAARLSRMAAREENSQVKAPMYDLTDKDLRLVKVSVSGFRGSAGAVTISLSKNGKPADVLLWGDNGTGKSSLIDGIEFALQHRVDRSSDFNGSLRAAVRNLTVSSAFAEVELNDGSVVSRSLVTNKAGRDEPSSLDVRPGFRIAPVVIRRADILRFLDTDALARGTVFFDYFPDPDGTLGVRPDEELRQLEEERFLLRVARDDLSAQLAELYPEAGVEFGNSAGLDTFVTNLLASVDTSGYDNPIDALPDSARHLIVELNSAQRRGSQIKKKLDKGVQTLNPVAYKSQLSRVVPILQTVTSDLTSSFKRISQADHVSAIRVLVAKSGPVSLDVVVEFDNGKSALPQQVFSEGYKDLIALLFFLTVTKKAAEFGQAKVLILDDALQSVDSSVRLGVMEYVLDEFKDWQLVVAGHDRAWFALLRDLFARRGRAMVERRLTDWSFVRGIGVSGATTTRVESLREAIDRADERMVAAGIGPLLEEISSELSWRLEISVTRREGDRYSLGHLWPGVAKALKRTSLKDVVEAIDLRIGIRNLVGAHYNVWAEEISWSEIRQLGESSIAIYNATYCSACSYWIEKANGMMSCRCGALTVG